ncbi:rap1 GTPase-GDP dissociation stimulator 1-like isoform X2 [Xenia sp. Carnegie-2017]|uniref:rap1 GTPase-GDP dissociation stimulator 1-like isoform X2 n=1 Tax=Xenia sp. Carnegie-2017 TaxID=2897299 RepID=UPI001F033B69|nr:rap1 GTPase-GDP dissociation stimulator 1-like isoform X2 [Xenia sp. Carnegie-2017]
MDNLTEILETIKNSFNRDQSSTESHIANLRVAIDSLKDNEVIGLLDKISVILPQIKSCLNSSDVNLTASLLELIAEICKHEECRDMLVEEELIRMILKCFNSKAPEIVLHTFRCLGNLACDNNHAREVILNVGGVDIILNKIKELQNEGPETNVRQNVTACGAVLNISFENDMLQKELIRNGFVPLLLGYVEHNETNENLALMATNAIASLLDQEEGVSSFNENKGCEIFIKALRHSKDELTTSLAECLKMIAEEDTKHVLLSGNCFEVLQEIVLTNMTSENTGNLLEKLKVSVNLIILLLGDDDCLAQVFAGEKNTFVEKILRWTKSSYSYVRNSCPVAIGNIARTDENCIQLVKMGVHEKLINLLSSHREDDADKTELQTSVLSALKNFAIPASNKQVLINAGILNFTMEILCSSDNSSSVMYRAIAVIRLLVQGVDAAVDIVCSSQDCLKNVVSIAKTSGIEGLKSEASRLLATLLKNTRKLVQAILVNDGMSPIIAMVTSQHALMQNEALMGVALALSIINEEHLQYVDESNMLESISHVLNNETNNQQTLYNSMAVIEALFIKGLVEKSKLEDSGILHKLETFSKNSHNATKQRAASILEKIKT